MTMQRIVPTLVADDMDRTSAFYRDLLAFGECL
jgi:catechol 2,3-dioxygenase-like lactoylglutathione lyase family enzyme